MTYVNVIECNEFKPGKDKKGNEVRIKTKFKWLTNLHVTKDNLVDLSDNGGRRRWKIENEGINVQKNGGYGLKHAYCREPNAFKIILRLDADRPHDCAVDPEGKPTQKDFPSGPRQSWQSCIFVSRRTQEPSYHPYLHA